MARLLSLRHRPAALLALAALLAACGDEPPAPAAEAPPPPPSQQEQSLSGLWVEGDVAERVLVLDESQQLHLLGFEDQQGHRWHANSDTLKLESVTRSTGLPRYQQIPYTLTDDGLLTLNDEDGAFTGSWQRDATAAVRIAGDIRLPEDFGMPADAVLAITLEEQDADGLPAKIVRRQLSRPPAGAEALSYRFYIPPPEVAAHPQARLTVRVLVDGAQQYHGHSAALAELAPEQPQPITLKALSGATRGATAAVRTLHGEYVYFADAALFTECATGRRYPVAYSEGGVELERAYLAQREIGEDGMPTPVLMTVTGTLQDGPGAEEGSIVEQLFVQTLERTIPGATCATRGTAELENTYWKLTHLGSRRISGPTHQREAHMVLHSAESQARGNLGCNSFTGSYERGPGHEQDEQEEQGALRFGHLASTKMACLGGMDTEGDFSAALAATHSTRIDGETLYLLDANGKTLAQLQAIYLY